MLLPGGASGDRVEPRRDEGAEWCSPVVHPLPESTDTGKLGHSGLAPDAEKNSGEGPAEKGTSPEPVWGGYAEKFSAGPIGCVSSVIVTDGIAAIAQLS